MYQYPIVNEVGLKVLNLKVVDGNGRVQLLQLQARDNPRVAGEGMDAISKRQIPSRDPALAHHVERMVGRRIDDAPTRLDVQKLVIFTNKDFFDFLQRRLAGFPLHHVSQNNHGINGQFLCND